LEFGGDALLEGKGKKVWKYIDGSFSISGRLMTRTIPRF